MKAARAWLIVVGLATPQRVRRNFPHGVDTQKIGVDIFAGFVDTAQEMPTEKTRSVSARVPVPVADALKADAEQIDITPGKLLRNILTKRYSSVSPDAGKGNSHAGNSDAGVEWEMPDGQ